MVKSAVMDLRSYLTTHKIGIDTFAEAIQVKPASLYRYLAGERLPRRDVMLRIEQETRGFVRPNDFFSATSSDDQAA